MPGFCTFAVGAVYDRATFSSEWAKCAVIDRAYSGFARSGAAAREGNVAPRSIWALLAENHLSEFFAKPLDLLRIRCGSKAFGEFEERLLLLLFCFKTFFDKFMNIRLALRRWRFAMLRT